MVLQGDGSGNWVAFRRYCEISPRGSQAVFIEMLVGGAKRLLWTEGEERSMCRDV